MNALTRTTIALLLLCFAAPLAAVAADTPAAEPALGPTGLHHQPWFLESFLDLRDDLQEAHGKGKRFAIIWEQRGCPYCRETHVVNFAVPEIRDYIRANFEMVQLDLRGAREVTDFDGSKMSERDLARKYGVRFTPTVTFFAEALAAGQKAEVARMTGYYRPFHFLAAFQYVREKAYATTPLRDFLKQRHDQRVREGKPVTFR